MLNPFKRRPAEPIEPPHDFNMLEVLARVTGDDTERAPEAHTQVDRLQAELADRITHADYRDADLTKRIDFLLEERRQVRVVRDALYSARVAAAEAIPAISEASLSAELEINYANANT